MTRQIRIKEQEFILHHSGAMHWVEESMLLISDVHLGKISHFRKYGAAVPRLALHKNFRMLDEIVRIFRPEKVCFLGDLFHSHLNKEWDFFESWVRRTPGKIILVAGNHDIISPVKYEDLGIDYSESLKIDGFLLTHHPEKLEGYYNISGHIHPAVRLRGQGRQSLRLPCFFKSPEQLILPAFGNFTGSHILPVEPENEVYAITDTEVLKI